MLQYYSNQAEIWIFVLVYTVFQADLLFSPCYHTSWVPLWTVSSHQSLCETHRPIKALSLVLRSPSNGKVVGDHTFHAGFCDGWGATVKVRGKFTWILNFLKLHLLTLYTYVYVLGHVCHGSCGGRKTTYRSWFSSSTLWILGNWPQVVRLGDRQFSLS